MINRFIEVFENHQIHSSIETVKGLIENIEIKEIFTPEIIVEFNRLKKALIFVESCIKSIDPEIVPINLTTQTFNQMVQEFTNVINYMNQFISRYDIGTIKNANAHIDNILRMTVSLNYIKTKSTARAIANSTRNYNKIVEEYINKLKRETEDLEKKNLSINDNLDAIKGDIDEISKLIDAKNTNFKKLLDDYDDRLESSTSGFEREKEKIIEELNLEIKSKFNELETNYAKLKASFETRYEEKVSKIYSSAESIINILEEKKTKASNLLQIIGNIGVTGDFKNNAEKERKNANIFRIVALIFMGLTVIGAIYIVFMANRNGFDWQYTLIKLLTTSTLSIPATYAAKESAKHRAMERKYRKMQLELATIDPFIEELPDERRIELKSEMTKKIFANNELDTTLSDKEDNTISVSTIWNLLENVVKGLSSKK